MPTGGDRSRPLELIVDGLSAMPGNDDRIIGVLVLISGIGGLSTSWVTVGGILGASGTVLGIITMAKAMSVKRRVWATGREAAVSGSFGLGIVDIVMGTAVIVVSLMLYASTSDTMSGCEKYEHAATEYAGCISKQMGTDQLKGQQQQ